MERWKLWFADIGENRDYLLILWWNDLGEFGFLLWNFRLIFDWIALGVQSFLWVEDINVIWKLRRMSWRNCDKIGTLQLYEARIKRNQFENQIYITLPVDKRNQQLIFQFKKVLKCCNPRKDYKSTNLS